MTGPPGARPPVVAPSALVPGALAVALGTAAHVLAGGATVGPAAFAVLVLLLAPTAAIALRGRPSHLRMVAVVVVLQAAVHALLLVAALANRTRGGHGRLWDGSDPMLGMPGMADETAAEPAREAAEMSGAAWATVGGHLAHDLTTLSGLAVVGAHVVAAVLLGLWLARGEQLLVNLRSLALARTVARAVRRSSEAVARLVLRLGVWRELLTSWRGVPTRVEPRGALVVSTVVRRGPPARVVVVGC